MDKCTVVFFSQCRQATGRCSLYFANLELCTFTFSLGKSTVAALLERFYDPQEGEVSIDGYNLRSLDSSWVRAKVIGYINQEPILFATTILENIRYGNQNATDQQVSTVHR